MPSIDGAPLGRFAPIPERPDPALLRPLPRAAKRAELGIGATLPFTGADLWTAYELSWLDRKGKPQVALAHLVVPAESPNLIESKSLKLYLNAFSQAPFETPQALKVVLERELAAATGAATSVSLVLPEAFPLQALAELEGESIDGLDVEISAYAPAPGLLSAGGDVVEQTLTSGLLKTNCPVTGQPDWASLQVRYRGPRIDPEGLLRYIVAFRHHADFHEHCVERMFVDLLRRCRPERLTLYARYTRRGGLDINPFRTNCGDSLPPNRRTARQ